MAGAIVCLLGTLGVKERRMSGWRKTARLIRASYHFSEISISLKMFPISQMVGSVLFPRKRAINFSQKCVIETSSNLAFTKIMWVQ